MQERQEAVLRSNRLCLDHRSQGGGDKRFVLKDGFCDRDASARLEDAMKFAQGGALVGNVRENGAGCDDIDGGVWNVVEPVSWALQKCTLALDLALIGEGFRVSEHGCGHVSDKNAQRAANAVDSAECDQTFSSSNVGERHARGEPRRVKNAIRVALNLGAHGVSDCGIAGVPETQQPLGPHIGLEV
jgi:hypothetical protein